MIRVSRNALLLIVPAIASCGHLDVQNIDDTDDNPCFTRSGGDRCSDPPPVCPDGYAPLVLNDDVGEADGSLDAVTETERDCATLWVPETAYYRLFGPNFAGSCASQLDESAYFTATNSCNPAGWPDERNAGDRFVRQDPDNTPPCNSDAECAPGSHCDGDCCAPDRVFLGTFFLVAGERNEVCMNHGCTAYREEVAAGRDPGFVLDGCSRPNSLHLAVSAFHGCTDKTFRRRCSWGCDSSSCLPDPCDAVSCPAYCKDGVCLDDNPCDRISCEHGCLRGLCLQNRNARGPDLDGDGYSDVADCDDTDPDTTPDSPEICADGEDDDCDGTIDEVDCR